MFESWNLYASSNGNSVLVLKRYLNELVETSPSLPINSTFDYHTKAAVIKFQRQFRFSIPDGVVDAYTWLVIYKALKYKQLHGQTGLRGAKLAFFMQDVTPQRTQTCNLVVPEFSKLSEIKECEESLTLLKRSFGDVANVRYESWSVHDKAVFLNTVAAVVDGKVNLNKAIFHAFYHGGHLDRPSFGVKLTGITKKDFGDIKKRYVKLIGIPFPISMGYRSPSSVKIASVEASPEKNGVVAFDVDLANPNGNFTEHQKEVAENERTKKTTDPRDVVKLLNKRGIKSGVICQ